MKKIFRLTSAVSAVVALVLAGGSLAASAEDGSSFETTLQALIELNPGVSEEEFLAGAVELAMAHGTTPEDILEQQLVGAQEAIAAANLDGFGVSPNSGGGGTISLGPATRKGDIFVAPAGFLFADYGHTGIYYTQRIIVHAPGINQNSKSENVSSVQVEPGTVKQYVNTSQANRNKAANYAYNFMRGKPYNLNFVSNKYVPADSYNCSQLVWGAYKHTTNIDLDGNGGPGVYPYDIKGSSLTVTYETL